MNNLTTCKSCGKEVAKSAKSCPHCGAKLKMSIVLKMLIALMVIGVVINFVVPGTDKVKARAEHLQTLQELAAQKTSDLSPTGELADMFNLGSDYTDLQRDAKEKELAGAIVEWKLPVYEVDIKDKEKKIYRVQTTGKGGVVSTFVNIHAMDDEDERILSAMKTGNVIHFKGKFKDVSMRSLNIDPAILVRNRSSGESIQDPTNTQPDMVNLNQNSKCQIEEVLIEMSETNLNIDLSECKKTKKFKVADINNGGQHIFILTPPSNGSMELDSIVITRDRNGKIAACGFGGDQMQPYTHADLSICESNLPSGVPAPKQSTGPDATIGRATLPVGALVSCNGLWRYEELKKLVNAQGLPEATNNCIKIRENTYDTLAKNGQIFYRYYALGSRGEGILAVLAPNNKPLQCGVFNEEMTEFFQWDIDECSMLEKDDLILHKRAESRTSK